MLDAVRGVAILLVLGVHSNQLLPSGDLGVDLFFVLSGFLITSLIVSEHARTGGVSLRSFYARRARRLTPALAVMLTVYVTLAGASLAVLFGATYTSNIAQAFGGQFDQEGLRHLWSLATEEQFYLFWPPILVVALRRDVRPRRLAGGLLVYAVAAMVYRDLLLLGGAGAIRLWFSPDTHADGLALGCAAAIAYMHGLIRPSPRSAAIAGIVGAIIVCFAWPSGLFFSVAQPSFVACATLLLIVVATDPAAKVGRILDRKLLRSLGKISYGLYLWHWPIFVAVGWVAGLPIALVVSLISYRYVERPFLATRSTPAGDATLAPAKARPA